MKSGITQFIVTNEIGLNLISQKQRLAAGTKPTWIGDPYYWCWCKWSILQLNEQYNCASPVVCRRESESMLSALPCLDRCRTLPLPHHNSYALTAVPINISCTIIENISHTLQMRFFCKFEALHGVVWKTLPSIGPILLSTQKPHQFLCSPTLTLTFHIVYWRQYRHSIQSSSRIILFSQWQFKMQSIGVSCCKCLEIYGTIRCWYLAFAPVDKRDGVHGYH